MTIRGAPTRRLPLSLDRWRRLTTGQQITIALSTAIVVLLLAVLISANTPVFAWNGAALLLALAAFTGHVAYRHARRLPRLFAERQWSAVVLTLALAVLAGGATVAILTTLGQLFVDLS